jgi:hypothetical protein
MLRWRLLLRFYSSRMEVLQSISLRETLRLGSYTLHDQTFFVHGCTSSVFGGIGVVNLGIGCQ